MSSSAVTPTTTTPDFSQVPGHQEHPDARGSDTSIWQRAHDFFTLPTSEYQKKYSAQDEALENRIEGAVEKVIPFAKEIRESTSKTPAGKEIEAFAKPQLEHPEQMVMTGGLEGPEGEAIESAFDAIPGHQVETFGNIEGHEVVKLAPDVPVVRQTVQVDPKEFIDKVSRGKIDSPTVENYRSQIRSGQQTAPAHLNYDSQGNVIGADGRHRALAHLQEGKPLTVEVTRQVPEEKPLPPQPRLPETGSVAAIRTDDGGIYPDIKHGEGGRTHIQIAQDYGIPADRIVGGGWINDGVYDDAGARSDAGRYGEQARARKAVEGKRDARQAVEAAGGIYHGQNKDGLVEIFLPRSLTEDLPLSDRFKDFVSVTLPADKITPESVTQAMHKKVLDMGGKPMAEFGARGEQPIRAYHGTAAAKNFEEFKTEGRPVDEKTGEPLTSGSGADPTSYLGAHFAKEPEIANKFAGRTSGWLRSRYEVGEGEQGSAGPRVIPVDLQLKNPKNFGSEHNLRGFIYQGDLSNAGYAGDEILNELMRSDEIEDPEEGGEEVDKWLEKYQTDPEFREDQNRAAFEAIHWGDEEGTDDMLHEAARDLASQARARLQKMGHDGAIYKNEVEGGTGYVAFSPRQIKSAFQKK